MDGWLPKTIGIFQQHITILYFVIACKSTPSPVDMRSAMRRAYIDRNAICRLVQSLNEESLHSHDEVQDTLDSLPIDPFFDLLYIDSFFSASQGEATRVGVQEACDDPEENCLVAKVGPGEKADEFVGPSLSKLDTCRHNASNRDGMAGGGSLGSSGRPQTRSGMGQGCSQVLTVPTKYYDGPSSKRSSERDF